MIQTAADNTTQKKLISLCMIARDNEDIIEAALESVTPWVDEVIVVDTGSKDRTKEIAKQLGARVEFFEWCDDFAAARNASLEYATGDWVFWMDTDDTIPAESGRKLRQILESPIDENVLGLIMQVHCPTLSADDLTDADEQANAVVVDHVKVFRNMSELRFEGRIHEQVLPSIRAQNGDVLWTDCFVVHSGSDQSPEAVKRKLDRDLQILQLDLEERPDHPFVLFNLGMTLLFAGEPEESKVVLERCIDFSTTSESHLRKAYALLVDACEQLDTEQAKQRCWEGLGRYPNDAELAFKLGRLLMLEQHWADAIEGFGRVVKRCDADKYFASIDSGITGYKTMANLAVCHTRLGEYEAAIGAWQSCLLDAPGFVDGWEGVIDLSRLLDDVSPLQAIVEKMKKTGVAESFILVCRSLIVADEDTSAAIPLFEKALETNPRDKFLLDQFARFLNEQGRWDRSIPVLNQLIEQDSSNPSPYHNLGIALTQVGKHAEAIEALKDSLRLRPDHEATQKLLSQCEATESGAVSST